jgi:hypothetical protein
VHTNIVFVEEFIQIAPVYVGFVSAAGSESADTVIPSKSVRFADGAEEKSAEPSAAAVSTSPVEVVPLAIFPRFLFLLITSP